MEHEIEQELERLQRVYDLMVNFLVNYSFQLVGALLVLLVGIMVANKVAKGVLKLCQRKQLDITLSRFFSSVAKIALVVMVAIICLNMIGISITPFVAAIGAASLGVGLAMQGLLSNYGAGLNIILTRPFVVDDTISVQGVSGQVKDILLAYTLLVDEDGVEITIPNKHIVGEILHNSHAFSLVELDIGVAYSSDLEAVINMLQETITAHTLVGDIPAPQVGIITFGDSGVNIQVRFWTPTDKMILARYTLNKLIWDTLKANQIEIPFPQREIRLLNQGQN